MRISNRLRRTFAPLNVTCDLIVEGGALHQIHKPDTEEFSPDRAITPLTIRPVINITDLDGVFGDGNANAKLGHIKWLANKVNVSGNSKYSIDTTKTTKKGSLRVIQNVAAGAPVVLYFEGVIADTRNGTSIKVNGSVLMNTNTVSKEKVTVEIDKPSVIIFNPISTPSKLIINASVYLADTIQANGNTKLWWYKRISNGTLVLLDIHDDLEYISGIGTSKLAIDQRYINKIKNYRLVADFVKTGDPVPSVPTKRAAFIDFSVRRRYGDWKAKVLTYGDITANQSIIKAKAIITSERRVITNPDEIFDLQWYTVNASGTEQRWGTGSEDEIPANISGIATGGIDVGVDINDRASLKANVLNGKAITLNNKLIVI
jgi:hypothetical protein